MFLPNNHNCRKKKIPEFHNEVFEVTPNAEFEVESQLLICEENKNIEYEKEKQEESIESKKIIHDSMVDRGIVYESSSIEGEESTLHPLIEETDIEEICDEEINDQK
jgi:hypothetical protein